MSPWKCQEVKEVKPKEEPPARSLLVWRAAIEAMLTMKNEKRHHKVIKSPKFHSGFLWPFGLGKGRSPVKEARSDSNSHDSHVPGACSSWKNHLKNWENLENPRNKNRKAFSHSKTLKIKDVIGSELRSEESKSVTGLLGNRQSWPFALPLEVVRWLEHLKTACFFLRCFSFWPARSQKKPQGQGGHQRFPDSKWRLTKTISTSSGKGYGWSCFEEFSLCVLGWFFSVSFAFYHVLPCFTVAPPFRNLDRTAQPKSSGGSKTANVFGKKTTRM